MNWIKRLWWSAILLAILIAGAIVWSWEPDRQLGELVARWAPEPSRFVELDGMQVHLRSAMPWAAALAVSVVTRPLGARCAMNHW